MDNSTRLLAVKYVLGGMTKVDAARKYNVSRQTITKWVKVYASATKDLKAEYKEQFGNAALEKLSFSKGRKKAKESYTTSLTTEQKSEIMQLLKDTLYTSRGLLLWEDIYKIQYLKTKLWNVNSVKSVIKYKYNVSLSYGIVERMLKAWGYVPISKKDLGYNARLKAYLKQRYQKNYRLYLDSKCETRRGYVMLKNFYKPYFFDIYISDSTKAVYAINHLGHYFFAPIDENKITNAKNFYYSKKYPLALAMTALNSFSTEHIEAFISTRFQKYLLSEETYYKEYRNMRGKCYFLKSSF